MSTPFQEIKARLLAKLRKQAPELAGKDGEAYAEKWLAKAGCEYTTIEQCKDTLSEELRKFGGKRPDFIIDSRLNSTFLADAKYHSTDGCSVFSLTDCELGKYRKLLEFCKNEFPDKEFDVVFMVVPKELNGKKLVWVHLDEFNSGTPTTIKGHPSTQVSLLDREELWCQIES